MSKFCLALSAVALMIASILVTPVVNAQDASKEAPQAIGSLKPEYFTRDPFMSAPQLSPDGTHLAWIEDNRVVIHDLGDHSEKVSARTDRDLDSLEWTGNDYLVVYIKDVKQPKSYYNKVVNYSPFVITRDARYVRLLFEHDGARISYGDLLPIINYTDGPSPQAVVIDNDFSVTIDIATGKRKSGDKLMTGTLHFFDHQGREFVTAQFLDGKVSYGYDAVVLHFRTESGTPMQTLRLPKQDKSYYVKIHYSEFEKAIYWSEFNYKTGVCSLFRYDTRTGQKTLYRTGPNKDLDLAFDRFGRMVGVTTVSDRLETEWTDPYHLTMTAAVQKLFPDAYVYISDMTRDGQNIVFLISAPDAPDSYYYYSAKTKDLVRIGGAYPELEGQKLAAMTYVTYKARDGLDIPAYITKRADTPSGAPLIVMPHGGPASRDIYDFYYRAQYFASRGYVVLQPQYRGSSGFGDTFQRAGNLHLEQMTTDMEDGVRHLQAEGAIDPKRVCVVGWSWGGYLAQAALAFTPQTYACGVSGAGISDLFSSLEEDNDIFWGGYSYEYWHDIIGSDSRMIHATSPIEHVDGIHAPLLLIHGKLDDNVSVHQSQRINEAMRRAGKDVTYIEMPGMEHSPETAEERQTILKAMDDFITRSLSGKSAGK